MGTVANADFWNDYSGLIPFIDKGEAVRNGTRFEIQTVDRSEGNFGPQWVVGVVNTTDNTAGKISFTCSPNRDQKMTRLRQALDAGVLVDAVLVEFITKTGQKGYDFAPAEDEPSDQQLSMDIPF